MSDDAFERLLDREVSQYVDAPASTGMAGTELIERALDQVGSPAAAASAGGIKLAAAVAGTAVVAVAGWVALRSPEPSEPAPAPAIVQVETKDPVEAPAVPAEVVPEEEPPAEVQVPEPATTAEPEPEPRAASKTEPTGPSAAELLRLAQQQRGEGKTDAAAKTYRDLLDAHPRSSEAKISLISLGELELVEQKRPAKALRYFDRYLRAGGPLSEEALHGRVRALRKLGRSDDELEAIDALLSAHPGSVYADSVEKRRAALSKAGD